METAVWESNISGEQIVGSDNGEGECCEKVRFIINRKTPDWLCFNHNYVGQLGRFEGEPTIKYSS